jgi:hypothetical protein
VRPRYLLFFRFDRYTSAARIQNFKQGESIFMSRRSLPLVFAMMALCAMSVSVSAKNDSGDSVTANIKLTAATTIGTTQLAAGEYKVTADGSKAKFQQGGKVVAEIPCTLKDSTGKVNETTFIIDNNKLTEIQISGKSKMIEFSSGM